METEQPIKVINIHVERAWGMCTNSSAYIIREDLQIGLERAYLAKASIYYLSLRHQKGDFVMTLFNSYAKVMQSLKMEIHPKAQHQRLQLHRPGIARIPISQLPVALI